MTTSDYKTHSQSLFTQYFTPLKNLEEQQKVMGTPHFFVENKFSWFQKFYPYQNATPSHDVLNKLFNRLDT